jgi:ATP-dependent Clp protease ATP-binding subunit ClpA
MQSYRIFDVVYMVIEEVKTVLDKNTMTGALNNIASVKQLIFIPTSNASADSSK